MYGRSVRGRGLECSMRKIIKLPTSGLFNSYNSGDKEYLMDLVEKAIRDVLTDHLADYTRVNLGDNEVTITVDWKSIS